MDGYLDAKNAQKPNEKGFTYIELFCPYIFRKVCKYTPRRKPTSNITLQYLQNPTYRGIM